MSSAESSFNTLETEGNGNALLNLIYNFSLVSMERCQESLFCRKVGSFYNAFLLVGKVKYTASLLSFIY